MCVSQHVCSSIHHDYKFGVHFYYYLFIDTRALARAHLLRLWALEINKSIKRTNAAGVGGGGRRMSFPVFVARTSQFPKYTQPIIARGGGEESARPNSNILCSIIMEIWHKNRKLLLVGVGVVPRRRNTRAEMLLRKDSGFRGRSWPLDSLL